jgi:D-alanyl-D-alanine carboxypeptidase/Putative peptidoglycan binding domain
MLKVLRLGSIGPIVRQWQTFLRGQGFVVAESGIFDAQTEAATRAFQTKHKLDVDGKVGNQTFGKAAMLGFELVDNTEADSDFPALPSFAPLAGNAARQSMFGPLLFEPAPKPGNPEAIRITNGWEQANLVKVPLPQLAGIKGAPASAQIMFHKKGAAQLQRLWKAWQSAGVLDRVLTFDGAFNPRFIRGGAAAQILSNHAFATAFDINARFNSLGAQPATPTQQGCVYDLVAIAHKHGFYWGGHFSRRDGMHFELAQLMP